MHDDDEPIMAESEDKDFIFCLSYNAEEAMDLPSQYEMFDESLVIDLGNIKAWRYIDNLGNPQIRWDILVANGRNLSWMPYV